MKAYEKNDIVSYSTVYSHVIPMGTEHNLEAYADLIEANYNFSTPRTKEVCRWLRGTEGTISRNRNDRTSLKFRKHID